MHPRQNLSTLLLVLIAILAVSGGVATAVLTSPQSFDLSRLAFLQASLTPANTPAPTATDSATPPPPTVTPSATRSVVLPIYLPTDTETSAVLVTNTPGPSPTATATNIALPADVWALAHITELVGTTLVRVHDIPNGGQLVAAIPAGTVVQVLFGQAVVDGVTWLLVRLPSGRTGWVADYLLVITIHRPAGTGTLEALGTPASAPPTDTATANNPAPPKTAAPPPSQTAAPTVGPGTTAPPSPTHAPTSAPTNTPTIAVIVIDTFTPAPSPTATTPAPTATTPVPPTATDILPPSDTPAVPTPTDAPTNTPMPTDTPTADPAVPTP